ncbi:DUF2779 domain-containing protein [Hyphococcus sp.]|uniref:DUF2779 domain-containing protein n=1 Tax=Hyphococcus sp. TaxID=2038636 RepID=UPI0035C66691
MRLTKSLIAAFDQCPKRLWLEAHKGAPTQESPQAELRKAEGERIGVIARTLRPGGTLVDSHLGQEEALAFTQKLLAATPPAPIFEAAFLHDNTYIRVDILTPLPGGSWYLVEVKSAASLKDHYVRDLATQLYVAKGAGLNIGKASVWHIDSSFILRAIDEYDGLFSEQNDTENFDVIVDGRPQDISTAQHILDADEPDVDVGDHCTSPYDCPFQDYCSSLHPSPPDWPTTLLPAAAGKKAAAALADLGIEDLLQVPIGYFDDPKLHRIHQATVSGIAHHEREAIRKKIAEWRYPLHFLDFETIQFAAPIWLGGKSYAQTPFQFSNHILQEDGALSHHEFLDLSGNDPRRACAEALVEILCAPDVEEGSIVAYFAGFEKQCIKGLALIYDDLRESLMGIHERVVDLLPVVREHYYHRDQRGSWSIKAVLPTVCPELDYADLEVKDGTNAQSAYVQAIDPSTPPQKKSAIGSALKEYCKRDTLAMVKLLLALSE